MQGGSDRSYCRSINLWFFSVKGTELGRTWCALTSCSAAVTSNTSGDQVAGGWPLLNMTFYKNCTWLAFIWTAAKQMAQQAKMKADEHVRLLGYKRPSEVHSCVNCATFNPNWWICPHHIFMGPFSAVWSINIKTLCKAFYIQEHFDLVAWPGAQTGSRSRADAINSPAEITARAHQTPIQLNLRGGHTPMKLHSLNCGAFKAWCMPL